MKWEYKVVRVGETGFWSGEVIDSDAIEQMMNELGEQGWEMTRVVPVLKNAFTHTVLVFFKRQKT